MTIFTKLAALRAKQRTLYPFDQAETTEDHDLIYLIGAAQEAGKPTCTKQILLSGVGAQATIRRRMDRLVKLGVVLKSASQDDGRVALLHLNTEAPKRARKLLSCLAA